MAFKILYHEDALADLREIFAWSAARHPDTTEKFADDLLDHIELLQAHPYLGAPVKGHPELRRLLHSPLFVYYHVAERRGSVEIMHFRHTARRGAGL